MFNPVNFLIQSNSVQVRRGSDQAEERDIDKNDPEGETEVGRERGREREGQREGGRICSYLKVD